MGAESEGRLRVIAEGAAEAADQLDRVADGAEKVAEGTDQVGESSRRAGFELQNLRGALAATGFALAAREWKSLVDEGEALGDVLGQVGAGSIDLANQVTQRLVPSMDLARARGRLLAADLQVTDAQFAAIAAAANVYAIRTGTEVPAALDQLTNALIAGNARGLRPFGIGLADGTRGAEGTRQAVEQLSRQLGTNAQTVAESTGAWDRLNGVLPAVRENAAKLVASLMSAPDVIAQGVRASREMRAAVAGPDGLEGGFNAGAAAADRMIASLPFLSSEMATATSYARGLARALLGIRVPDLPAPPGNRGAELASSLPGGGADDTVDRAERLRNPRTWAERQESARLRAQADRDLALANMRVREAVDPTFASGGLILDTPEGLAERARRRGGGGGGGARDDRTIEEALAGIADAAQRRVDAIAADLEEQERRLREMAADEDVGGFGAGGSDAFLRGGFGERAGAFNAERRGGAGRQPLGGARNSSQQVSAMARSTDSAVKYADALGRLGEVGSTALGALTNAVTANVEAWVSGEKTIGQALLGILSQTLSTIAKESAVKALLYTAEGFAMLVTGNVPASTSAFTAAGLYTAAAVAAGVGSAVVGAATSGGGSHGRSRYQGGSAAVSAHSGAVSDGGGGGVSIHYHVAPGAMIGEQRRTEDRIVRMTREGARRAARVQNRPEPRL